MCGCVTLLHHKKRFLTHFPKLQLNLREPEILFLFTHFVHHEKNTIMLMCKNITKQNTLNVITNKYK